MKNESNKMPFEQYGERGRIGMGKANAIMMGGGPVWFFNDTRIPVWFNAPMNVESQIPFAIPMLLAHGLFS